MAPEPASPTAFLRSSAALGQPSARLNTMNVGRPFATVDLTQDGLTYIAVSTPAGARAMAAAFEAAAVLLEDAAQTGPEVTP